MMKEDLVQRLQAAPHRGVLVLTGGGSGALPRLLTTPGASATVLEAVVPYCASSLADWLGAEPQRACDEATARQMAMRAFERARELDASGSDPHELFGLGCTASLATNRPKRGEHRLHVAIQTARRTLVVTLGLEKDRRTRNEEEAIAAHAIVAALAEAAGVHQLDLAKTPPGVEASVQDTTAPPEWVDLLLGDRSVVALNGAEPAPAGPICLFPGSFNPPHLGHAEIARIAAERTGCPTVYELSITNVDKPSLDFVEIDQRIGTLGDRPIWLTRAATFLEKAELAPGVVFAAGADTVERIGKARYYGQRPGGRQAALNRLAERGVRFLVFGRSIGERFEGLADLELPPALRELCEAVPESEFRMDISSTTLRARQ